MLKPHQRTLGLVLLDTILAGIRFLYNVCSCTANNALQEAIYTINNIEKKIPISSHCASMVKLEAQRKCNLHCNTLAHWFLTNLVFVPGSAALLCI